MEGVTKVVEITIGKEMPVDIGLILDDCSFGPEQYQGVYGCYETPSGPFGITKILLAFVLD
ncbi:hypothetical protein GQ600_20288 [Phytophthora cactorum]|nr:hypothetical protein GQ600_20288 [Phytophthora cactorum]